MKLQIIKANDANIMDLTTMNYNLFLHDYPYDTFLYNNWPYSDSGNAYFKKAVTDENYCAFIAKISDKPVGYLIGYIWENWESRPVKTAEIDNMFVLDNYRGKGVGKTLIDEFKQWCISKEVKDIVVMAYQKNEHALEFYKKYGFENLSVRLHQILE